MHAADWRLGRRQAAAGGPAMKLKSSAAMVGSSMRMKSARSPSACAAACTRATMPGAFTVGPYAASPQRSSAVHPCASAVLLNTCRARARAGQRARLRRRAARAAGRAARARLAVATRRPLSQVRHAASYDLRTKE